MTRFFSKEIAKALFSRKKDHQIQIKSLKIKEMNPKLEVNRARARKKGYARGLFLIPRLTSLNFF
jgi:hypothetical protein